MLKERVVTAAVLLVVFLSVVFFLPSMIFTVFVVLVAGLGAWEWSRLCNVNSRELQYAYGFAVAITALLLMVMPQQEMMAKIISLLALLMWAFLIARLVLHPVRRSVAAVGDSIDMPMLIVGVGVFAATAISMNALHHGPNTGSPWMLLYVLGIVWVMDIGAYFSGRKFGRVKLAPKISPGKTREGVYGGLLCALLLMIVALIVSGVFRENAGKLLTATIVAALVSVIGDLFESRLKRAANMKDSSQLLPGHGGVLDRIDGVVAALPVFLCIWLWS